MAVRGTTAHFIVAFDDSLGTDGQALADAVLATCEVDYGRLRGYFGEIDPQNLPLEIVIVPGMSGVSHSSCSSATISIDGFSNNDGSLVSMLAAAGVAETFVAAQAKASIVKRAMARLFRGCWRQSFTPTLISAALLQFRAGSIAFARTS